MKKSLIAILAAVLILTTFTACDPKEPESTDTPSQSDTVTTEEKTTDTITDDVTDENAKYVGYWQYGSGDVLQITKDGWKTYDLANELTASGPVQYDEDGCYLMNENGSSGGGKVHFNENGELMDGDVLLIKIDKLPEAVG